MATTLAQISARTAASLVKKLSGSDKAKFIKFGLTSKGQPWIVYQIDSKKCSQFISKKEWDFTKPEVFFVSEIRVASDTISPNTTPYLSGLYSVINLRKNSRYDVSYYRRSQNVPAITNCGCVAGQFKKSCKHQTLVKYLGDRRYDSMLADREKKSAPIPVSNPVPAGYVHPAEKECDRIWDEAVQMGFIAGNSLKLDNRTIYIAAAVRRAGSKQSKYVIDSYSYGTYLINTEWNEKATQVAKSKAESQTQKLADQRETAKAEKIKIARAKFDEIWDNPKQDFVNLDGRQAKRVSSLIVEDFDPFNTGYMIFELNHGNYLVKKASSGSPEETTAIATSQAEKAAIASTQSQPEKAAIAVDQFKIPGKIAGKVAEIRSQRSTASTVPPAVPSPSGSDSVFGSFSQSEKVYWIYIGEDSWSSTLGGFCKSSELEANVRVDLGLGYKVVCRSAKADYLCSFSVDNKIDKVAIPRSA